MSTTHSDNAAGLPSLAEQIGTKAPHMEPDDLAGLAQMHGWCESMLRQVPKDGDTRLLACCTSLRGSLESLVLGECEDPIVLLQHIQASAIELCGLVDGTQTPQAAQPAQSETAPIRERQLSETQIAAQLEQVFAEEPASPTAPPPPAAPAALAPYEQTPLQIADKELEFVKGFVEEAGEHVEAIEAALLEVERSPSDADKINDLFRPFHTIKGMAGFLNLRDINRLTHEVETLMDQARKGQRTVTPGLIDLVFDVVDVLKAQVGAIGAYVANPSGENIPQPDIVELMGHLQRVVSGQCDPAVRGETPPAAPGAKVGEVLVNQAAVAPQVVEFAVQRQEAGETKKTGEMLVEMGVTTPRQVNQALRAQAAGNTAAPAQAGTAAIDSSVRIDTAKLDTLIDMVGELVIAQTLVSGAEITQQDARLQKNVGQVSKIVRTVQEVVLAMRMVPIGSTFTKMARLVRDVSRKAGKNVELTISGEETELDKNVIQQISDPLVHMVRNAVDHGVESPQERLAAGKPEQGNVHLGACHQGGSIVITISDDGKGLDPQKLVNKAVEKSLIAPNAELTEQQIYGLIFAPGFSTAETITDISGRGVGMDVVKRNIDQLRGKVEITSEKGKGTTFQIRLPLTLAIIDGMVVRSAEERFIIPTIALEQALRPTPEQISTVQHRGEMLQLRGELIPMIQLGELFGFSGWVNPCEAMVVVAQCDGKSVGIVVEELIGQQQVVIKSLGHRFEGLRGISGATILGDGRVGLILEIAGLAAHHDRKRTNQRRDYTRLRTGAQRSTQQAHADVLACASN